MTAATSQPITPFAFSWCYDVINQGEQERCNILQIADPADVAPLQINISNVLIEDPESITIKPILEEVPNEQHHHFKLQFSKVIDASKIAVEGNNWLISSSSNDNEEIVYLLWQGEEMTLSPGDTQTIEIILTGVATPSNQSAVKTGTTEVTFYWDIESENYWDINSERIESPIPPPSKYFNNKTLVLDMKKVTGTSNIPLYVGFVNGNKVLNTHEEANSLQLRVTNTNLPGMTDPDYITFYHDPDEDSSNSSKLVVTLEAEDQAHAGILAPWALGGSDLVKNIGIAVHVAGETELWNIDNDSQPEKIEVGGETKGWKWTFTPQSEVVLQPQDTILIDLTNIITAHPTGETNLYLGYENVPNYQDGQFVCQIEKAPLLYDEKVRVGKEQTAVFGTREDVLKIESELEVTGDAFILVAL